MARRMRGCFDLNIDHAVHKGKKSPHHCTIGRTFSHRRRHRTIGYGEIVEVLAPVVQREIYYRMLRAELGSRLVDLVQSEGGNHRIVRAIEWLKQHYAAPLRIEQLAEAVHMSPSALHHRFKAVTAMSPLQYQKHLRLHGSRRHRMRYRGSSGGLRKCFAVQPRIPALVRRAAPRGDLALAGNGRLGVAWKDARAGHHTRQTSFLTNGAVTGHENASANSRMFTTRPLTRYRPGEWGSVFACTRRFSGRSLSQAHCA
jgi:Bacterial regulatory helix-turn-helix proteins, AraC family